MANSLSSNGQDGRTAARDVAAPFGLALRDVAVRFGGVTALNAVSLEVSAGECVGLIGPNGAGKTTLLDVAAGVRRPQAGDVLVHGQRITGASDVQRARLGMGRTFQKLSLFDGMTVRDHLVLGFLASRRASNRSPLAYWSRRSKAEAAAMADQSALGPPALLERLRLTDVADELAGEQSVGVARMVDLARALAARPKVLLLDEPVSGLSEVEATHVAEVLLSLRQDHELSVLIVEHNLEFARLVSDRMVALDFGEVIATGVPSEVLSAPELRRAYFGDLDDDQSNVDEGHRGDDFRDADSVSGGRDAAKMSGRLEPRSSGNEDPAALTVSQLEVQYGHVSAIRGVSFDLRPGERLAVLGPNGAGKSSLANAVGGLTPYSSGSIMLDHHDLKRLAADRRAQMGIGFLPDSRTIFRSLTVSENLRLFFSHHKQMRRRHIDAVYEVFPSLGRRKSVAAGKLSGGEQQMLAFARLMIVPPRLLIVDELSHGLAPGIVDSLFLALEQAKGVSSMIIIEQYVSRALQLAESVLVLSHGDVRHYGKTEGFTAEMATEMYSLHAGRPMADGETRATV